jgi:hypothetical protein
VEDKSKINNFLSEYLPVATPNDLTLQFWKGGDLNGPYTNPLSHSFLISSETISVEV